MNPKQNHVAEVIMNPKQNQHGNIILAILALVAIIGVIGAYMMAGNTNTASASASSGSVAGASLMNDGNAMQQTFQNLVMTGSLASSVTFIPNTPGVSNMLDPVNGMQLPIPTISALLTPVVAPNGEWIYNPTGFVGNGIGSAAADPVVYVVGVKDAVCAQIDTKLYGVSVIPSSGIAPATWTTGATAANPNSTSSINLATAGFGAIAAGWMSGCVGTGVTDQNALFPDFTGELK